MFVIAFLPSRRKASTSLISWLQSPSVVILEPKKIKSVTIFIVSPSICCEVMGPDAMFLVFWMLNFKPAFSFSSFSFIKRLFSYSSLSAIRMVSSASIWSYWYCLNASIWIQCHILSLLLTTLKIIFKFVIYIYDDIFFKLKFLNSSNQMVGKKKKKNWSVTSNDRFFFFPLGYTSITVHDPIPLTSHPPSLLG